MGSSSLRLLRHGRVNGHRNGRSTLAKDSGNIASDGQRSQRLFISA